MQKIGIFYVNAGGGHSGAAKALARELTEKYSDKAEVVLVDAGAKSNRLSQWLLHKGYPLWINSGYFILLWWMFYWISQYSWAMHLFVKMFRNQEHMNNLVKEGEFDIVISLYFFITPPLLTAVKNVRPQTEVWSVVTDPFTVPSIWFFEKNIKYFVFSELAKKKALVQGVEEENIFVVAPVINEKFLQARGLNQGEIRGKLGLPQDKKIILVAGGGDGLYRGGEIVESLMDLFDDFRLVVVCGREKKFFDQASCLKEKHPDKILSVVGFAENIEELMVATDLVVGKAGPAVIFESLTIGRPLILTHYIWGQEKGNRDFVVENGLGKYEPRMHKLAQTVGDFFSDENEYKNTLERINLLSLKTGVGEIVQKILKTKEPD